ncbi:hypothetical protein GCM10027286_37250 [Virgibacillus ainsalahensis]
MEYILLSITLMIVSYLLFKVITLESRIRGWKYTVDQLANQSGISENPINK